MMKQIVLLMVCLFIVVGMALVGRAEVNISIGVPPPPPLEFPAPPGVVVVPSESSDVYLVPNTAGLYFHGGYWYRFHGDYWFRSNIYNGPWTYIETPLIPPAVVVIPPDYILGVPPGYHRIHYGDFHHHWRDWGHSHHWGRYDWYRGHSRHHWGGREFHRPPVAHRDRDIHGKTDFHRKTDVHRKADVHGKTDVHRKADVHGKTDVHRKADDH
jgi:hypothetical protein